MAMRQGYAAVCLTVGLGCAAPLHAALLSGDVRDLNGKPVAGAMVSVSTALPGPTATTAFSDSAGHLVFPASGAYTQAVSYTHLTLPTIYSV